MDKWSKMYESLLDRLKEEREWSVLCSLDGQELKERRDRLENLFWIMVRELDDEQAVQVAGWILHAIGDFHLLPHLGPHGENPSGPTGKDAYEQAAKAQVEWCISAWQKLPADKEGQRYFRTAEDDGEMRSAKFAAMTETKKELLTQIVYRWRTTKDETEADALLDFLWRLRPVFEDDSKMFEAGLRMGTDRSFPPERAARQYLIVTNDRPRIGAFRDNMAEEIANLLSFAWIRNSDEKHRVRVLHAVLPVLAASGAAFERLHAVAAVLGAIDAQMRSLVKTIQPDKVEINYTAEMRPVLTVKYHSSAFLGYVGDGARMQFVESRAREWFEKLCEQAVNWRAENGKPKFTLVMEVAGKDDAPPQFRCEREFN
jgi:hypothetical protein